MPYKAGQKFWVEHTGDIGKCKFYNRQPLLGGRELEAPPKGLRVQILEGSFGGRAATVTYDEKSGRYGLNFGNTWFAILGSEWMLVTEPVELSQQLGQQ